MNATPKRDGEPKVLGSRQRLTGKPQVSEWKPMTCQEVEALPPLPAPPPRPPLAPPRAPESAQPAETPPSPASAAESAPPPRPRLPRPEWLEEGSVKAMVWDHPENAAMLLRTMLREEDVGDATRRQAGIVMLALGQEVAPEILKYLVDFELEEIAQMVAGLKDISAEMLEAELEEFRRHLQAGEWTTVGGMDYARGMLERAVGPRRAREIQDRVIRSVSSGFYMLKNVAPEQVAPFISHEHPQTIALILSQLDPGQAARIMSQLPERMQGDVSHRIATMENIPPEVIKGVEEALEASLRDVLGGNLDVGGPKVVADILNLTGSSVERNVLERLDEQNAEVAESVRDLMFVWADVTKLTDREMQTFLRTADQKDLVIALKATDEEMKKKLLGNVSAETREFLTEEIEKLGPMRLSEVEEVQLRLVHVVRELEEQGQLTIVRGDSDDNFV